MSDIPHLWDDEDMVTKQNIHGSDPGKRITDVQKRNAKVREQMQAYFVRAASEDYSVASTDIEEGLQKIFSTSAWGFREITLVIVIARLLDANYKASEDLYACKPRSLYEGPIRTELLQREIPHKLSGPLNVAKGTEKINVQWAARREPKDVALAVVQLVEKIDEMSQEELEQFAIKLHALFLNEQRVSSLLKVEVQPEADPGFLYKLCKQLIDNVADAGNTPQRIIGYLLQSYHETLKTGIIVSGHEDSASATNRSSKKVGDIIEKGIDKSASGSSKTTYAIYGITVKEFGERRVVEAYSSVRAFDEEQKTHTEEVIILCRKRDIHPDLLVTTDVSSYFGKLEYQDLIFYYQDIYEWIIAQLLRMPPLARINFYKYLDVYIQHPNTAQKVRVYWKHLHEEAPTL
jgi:hypothetical protein